MHILLITWLILQPLFIALYFLLDSRISITISLYKDIKDNLITLEMLLKLLIKNNSSLLILEKHLKLDEILQTNNDTKLVSKTYIKNNITNINVDLKKYRKF
jgi:hypothetical protein